MRIALFNVLMLVAVMSVPAARADKSLDNVQGKPNIIFILTDDLGWMDIGCYGNEFVDTPNIDKLASQGMRFTDFYAAGAVCSPTRASIQSGQNQARFGMTDFVPGHWRPFEKLIVPDTTPNLPLEIHTVAETLRDAGYATAYFGKWHLGDASPPQKQGYQHVIQTGGHRVNKRLAENHPHLNAKAGEYLTKFHGRAASHFIEQNKDKPFFAFISPFAVHIPLDADQDKVEKYRQKSRPNDRVFHPVYAAMVEHVDDMVGYLMAELDRMGLTKDTMLVFTSDNGGLRQIYVEVGDIVTTNAPLRDEKGSIYEGGIRVPLIVRWPAVVPAGTVCDEPTISHDFYPTFAASASADMPEGQAVDGANLLPVLRDPSASLDRDAIYWHYPHYHHSRPATAIRKGDWKLIDFYADPPELYNLAEDISESNNLAERHPDRVRAMMKRLDAWRDNVGAALPKKNPKYDPAKADQWWSRRSGKPIDVEAMARRYKTRN